MLRTLRGRFVLSHILPLLIVIPLMGIATISLIEKRILTPTLLTELKSNAEVLSRFAADDKEIWQDSIYARRLLSQISGPANGHLMILDSDGVLLASSDSADAKRLGTKIGHPGNTTAATGEISMEISSSQDLGDDRVEALAPVIDQEDQLLGYIRLSYEYSSFFRQLFQLRYLLTGILAVGLILGAVLGTMLAINVSKPIQEVTEKIDALAKGDRGQGLQETGSVEIRRLSQAVNTLFDRLHSLEQARKRLLANLVHEIGRPLGALRMGIEALSHGADRNPEFFKELLAGMDQETVRLQQLLEDLSQLHEQALGFLELDRVKLDLQSWLPETLSPWRQAATQKGLIWEMNIPKTLSSVIGDPLRLNQVLGNLLSNAIKYTPSGGKIRIEAGQTKDSLWLSVRDSGPGIAPEVQEVMFEPFVRGSQSTRFPQGMGLGLSIARELVEAHGGRLQLESELGAGAKFTVWLPLTP